MRQRLINKSLDINKIEGKVKGSSESSIIHVITELASSIYSLGEDESKNDLIFNELLNYLKNLVYDIFSKNSSFKKNINNLIKIENQSDLLDEFKIILEENLNTAIRIEHSTIPPYLTTLYSIKKGQNIEASCILRSVVIEEMLHMIMVCNAMNAMNLKPEVVNPENRPTYPYSFPFGSSMKVKHNLQSFDVNILSFSKKSLDKFIKIERPTESSTHLLNFRVLISKNFKKSFSLRVLNEKIMSEISTIGEYYDYLTVQVFVSQFLSKSENIPKTYREFAKGGLFIGDKNKQISPEQYYGSGGALIEVHNFHNFVQVVMEIKGQGEGADQSIFDDDQSPNEEGLELAHFYRFMEVRHEHYYKGGNYDVEKDENDFMPIGTPPNGNPLPVIWEASYPIRRNFKIEDIYSLKYLDGIEKEDLKAILTQFNDNYTMLLQSIQDAVDQNDKSQQNMSLQKSVMYMHQLRHQAVAIMKIPLGDGKFASPTWEF